MPRHLIEIVVGRNDASCRSPRAAVSGQSTRGGAAIAVVLACLLAGCAAQGHLQAGDQALASGYYAEAVRNYERALHLRPGWSEKSSFMANLQEARSEKVYAEGQAYLNVEHWQGAIDRFNATLAIDADHERARQALTAARQGAADAEHRAALDAATRGDRDAAEQALRQALAHVPEHPHSRLAWRSLEQPEAYPDTEVVAEHQHGVALADDKHWPEALARFAAVTDADGNYLPARLAAAHARQQLSEARELYTQGVRHAEARALDAAIDALEGAAGIWPAHPQASDLLGRVRTARRDADALAERAATALAQRRWDQAIADAERARELFPAHPEANEVAEASRDGAAEAWTQAGEEHLLADRLAAARDAFDEAVGYRPEHDAAHAGLAEVARRRGAAAERAGQLGQALLHYLEAVDHAPTERDEERLASLYRRVGEAAGAALALDADHADRQIAADSASLLAQVRASLAREAPHFLTIDAPGADRLPRFTAELHVLTLDVDEQRGQAEQLVHRYVEQREVPNPDIPLLEAEVIVQHNHLHHARHRHDRREREYQRARRHRPDRNDDDDDRDRRRQHDRRVSDLWSSRNRSARELRSAESALRHAEAQLRSAPATVIESIDRTWPYTRQTYHKTGELILRVRLHDPEAREAAASFTVEKTFEESDTQIVNPNPEVGLREDALSLPSDQAVRRALIDAAAAEAAQEVVDRIITSRTAALHQQARDVEAEGDAAAALEHRVQALVLWHAVDREAASEALGELSAAQRSQ